MAASGAAIPHRLGAGAFAAGALVLLPIAALAITALGGGAPALALLARTALGASLADTLMLLAGVAVLAGSMGFVSAWLVASFRFPGRDIVAFALMLPLAIPTYVAAYIAVELFDALGPVQSAFRALFGYRGRAEYWFPEVRSLPGAMVVLSFVLYPYVYLSVRALLALRCAAVSEVARTLGAGPLDHFRRVVVPLTRPALAAGLTFVLLETLNDVGASEYLGVRTLTVAVFDTWLNRGSLGGAAQLATLTLLAVVAILALEAQARRDKRYTLSVRRPGVASGSPLFEWRAWLAFVVCALPALIGFGLPAGFLVVEGLRILRDSGMPTSLARDLGYSAVYAGLATLAAVALGVAASLAVRVLGRRRLVLAKRLAMLGYALPGTVLALGLLAPFAALDNALALFMRDQLGLAPRQLLIGSGAAVVLALVARFTSLAIGGVDAGLERISTRIDEAAQNLGADAERLRRQVLSPLIRPAVAGAAILVFVDAIKELPATLLLRPLGVETLATALYGHAARGRFEDGALHALLILAVGLLPVMRLAAFMNANRALGGERPAPAPLTT